MSHSILDHEQGSDGNCRSEAASSRPLPSITNADMPVSIGRYRVIQRLGAGGMGEIFLGEGEKGLRFAIKRLPSHWQFDAGMRKRFVHEGEALAQLQHPNICRIWEIEEHGERPYIVMENVKGVSLAHLMKFIDHSESSIRRKAGEDTTTSFDTIYERVEELATRHGKGDDLMVKDEQRVIFPLQQSLAIIIKMCNAVQYAHERGILHRDIKPSNIVVRRDGEPILLDFGLAKWMSGDEQSLTVTGEVLGTLDYMAPEQAVSSKDIDERADVYGIGVILYEMVTGKKYFPLTGSPVHDLQRLSDHRPIKPRQHNATVDRQLEAVILKAAEPDRRIRYRSAIQLEADLRRYQEGLPVTAVPPTPFYRVRRFIRKYRAPFIFVSAISALVLGFGGYLSWDYYRQWGSWVRVFDQDFTKGSYDTTAFLFDLGKGQNVPAWTVDSAGLVTKPGEWCWLKGVEVRGDVRLDLEACYDLTPDGLEMAINAGESAPQYWYVPRGYSCQVGGWTVFDFLSINRKPGTAKLMGVVPSKARRGVPFRASLQRRGERFELYINGKRQCAERDNLAFWNGDSGRLGFHTYAAAMHVRRLTVYRMSLPEKADPLVAGESVRSIGLYREAVNKYLTIAHDYRNSPMTERALFGAYLSAMSLPDTVRRPVADSVLSELVRLFPRSPYLQTVRERQLLDLWTAGKTTDVLDRLPGLFAEYPSTRVALDLRDQRPSNLSETEAAGVLFPWLLRTTGLEVLNAGNQMPFMIAQLRGKKLLGLDCSRSSLTDLDALSGMRLCWLNAYDNEIADIRPLTGQPLAFCSFARNQVSDLGPLAGAPLKILDVVGCDVADLKPLARCPLEGLTAADNRITDLRPLAGRRIIWLQLHLNRITSIEPLRGMPLRQLTLNNNPVTDLSPIAGMRLTSLNISMTGIDRIDVLRGMPLEVLRISGCRISDLSNLADLPLRELGCERNGLVDLSALRGLPLRSLDAAHNNFEDLTPLAGMRLEFLDFSDNCVGSMAPLAGMPLVNLICEGNPITTLDPFIETTPPSFFSFFTPTLPDRELDRAIRAWSKNPALSAHVRNARLLKLINAGQPQRARMLADNFGKHKYLFFPARVSLEAADSVARSFGGHLVTITSKEELDFVNGLMPGGGSIMLWLDLVKDQGGLRWRNGESVDAIASKTMNNKYGLWGLTAWGEGLSLFKDDECCFVVEWDEVEP